MEEVVPTTVGPSNAQRSQTDEKEEGGYTSTQKAIAEIDDLLANATILEHQPMLERKIDTLIEVVISQGDVDLVLDETLVNIALAVDATLTISTDDKFDFVTNFMEPEAHLTENVPSTVVTEVTPDNM